MANHSYATFEGADPAALWSAFRKGIEQALSRFDALVVVEYDDDAAELTLTDPKGNGIASANFWMNADGAVEWRHGPDPLLGWWFQETVAAMACRHAAQDLGIGTVITDDGFEGNMSPDFDRKYPRFRDYEEKWLTPMQASGGVKGAAASLFAASLRWRPSHPEIRDILDRESHEPTVEPSGPKR